jgi:hypothetical protein
MGPTGPRDRARAVALKMPVSANEDRAAGAHHPGTIAR